MAEEKRFRSDDANEMLTWLICSVCTFAVFFFWLTLYLKAPDTGVVQCFGLPVGPLKAGPTMRSILPWAIGATGCLAVGYLAFFFSVRKDLRRDPEVRKREKEEREREHECVQQFLAEMEAMDSDQPERQRPAEEAQRKREEELDAEVEAIRRKEEEERRKRKEDIARKHEVAEAKRREQKEREREERDRQKREEEWKRWVQEHERAVAERLGKRNLTENTQTAHLAAAPSAEHLASTALAASGSEQYTSEAPAAENAESAEPADSEEERKALEDFFKI